MTLIDLSHRLPGPLSAYLLESLGANVIKIEDKKFSDPFKNGLFKEIDPSFPIWYQELNNQKEVQKFDFKNSEDHKKIKSLIQNSDGCVVGLPEKILSSMGLDQMFFDSLNAPKVILKLGASRESSQALHDLNAIAKIGLLELFLSEKKEKRLNPPFLPLGGITFGQQLATEFLAFYLSSLREEKVKVETTYLLESCHKVFRPFWSDKLKKTGQRKFLHNGLYPCYCIYTTKDHHHVALAAVEEKFWSRFCQLFELPFSPEDRFHYETDQVFLTLENHFSTITANEIKELIGDENLCLNIAD